MPVVRVKGVANPMQFPDNMDINDIREFLRQRFNDKTMSGSTDLTPVQASAQAYEPTLTEKIGSGIASGLKSTGLISDNYGAQQIGKNLASVGEFLPGIGDATAGDEFGRAAASGDKLGMGMAALGAIPLVGDAAKKGANLYKVHNITEGGLSKAKDLGGIPVPSLAVANKDVGFESFGDISLVGDKSSFIKDPSFASDVYSPRFPRSKTEINAKAARDESNRLSGMVDQRIDSSFDSQFYPDRLAEDITRLEESTGNRSAFLSQIGKGINADDYQSLPQPYKQADWYANLDLSYKDRFPTFNTFEKPEFAQKAKSLVETWNPEKDMADWWKDGELTREGQKLVLTSIRGETNKVLDAAKGPQFDRYKAKQEIDKRISENQDSFNSYIKDQKSRISKGMVFEKWNPNTGTSKKFAFNLDNAVKLMKGNIRGGEGFSYGVGNIRAQVAPKLTSIKQMQDKRGLIVGEDQMTMVKEGFDSRLDNLYDSLKNNWAYGGDPSYSDFADGITNAAKGDMADFKDLNQEQKAELKGFFNELANAPTNYFEIKPQRAVSVNEFYGAAVPEGTSKSVIDDLKAQGLQVEMYKPEKRKDAINKLNIKSGGNLFFSGAGAAILYGGSTSTKDDQVK